jgi:adenosine deaminase
VLEVCPSSNVATGVFGSYDDHPIGALREAGVRVTLGSDDPPYFGCSIGTEYAVAREHHGFEEEQLIDVTRLAVGAGFAQDAVREGLIARLDSPGSRESV